MDGTDDIPLDDGGQEPYPPDTSLEPDDDPTDDATGQVPVPRAAGIRKKVLGRSVAGQKVSPRSVAKGGKRILAREKQRKALELRKGGASYQQIAEAVGYKDQSGARKAVMKAFQEVIQEPATEVKSLQVERLNHLLLALWPKAQAGDERAIQTALGVMDRIDRLNGITDGGGTQVTINDHRNQQGILVIDGDKDEYVRALKKMAGIASDGTNVPQQAQIAPPSGLPTRDDDIIEAVLVDDTNHLRAGEEPVDTPYVVQEAQVVDQHTGPRKKFKFGVDPTVTKGQQDG